MQDVHLSKDKESISLKKLVQRSVRSTSGSQYKSALKTICSKVAELRGVKCVAPLQITKADFARFLGVISEAGNSSANSYRCALLWAHRQDGVQDSFAAHKDICLAVKGSKSVADEINPPRSKGCLTPAMLESFVHWMTQPIPTQHREVKSSSKCKSHPKSRAAFLKMVATAAQLQFHTTLRPGELEMLRISSLIHTTETVGGEKGVFPQLLFVKARKNGKDGERFIITEAAAHVFQSMAEGRAPDQYLLPRCVDMHIAQALQAATLALHWNAQLVWTAHTLKHSALSALEQGITASVTEYVAHVTKATFVGYIKKR